MARKPRALPKERLTIELDREIYKSWCNIGNVLNLTTNSRIAQYLVLCYLSQDESETNNKCETCGAMLTRHCARCTNEKSSWNAKSRKQPRERGEGQNMQNPGQTVHPTVKTKSVTNKIDTVHLDLVWVKNEPVDNVVGDMNIDHEQTQPCCVDVSSERDGRQNIQNPGQTVQTIVKTESSESDTVHSDSDGVKNEPVDGIVGNHNIDYNQTQQCCVEMSPLLKESDPGPFSLLQTEDREENLVNCNDPTKACTPLLSKALYAGNAESDKGKEAQPTRCGRSGSRQTLCSASFQSKSLLLHFQLGPVSGKHEVEVASSTSAGPPLTPTPEWPQPERADHLCPHCGKSYGNARALTRHMRLHHEYKCSFECQTCHKRFREASHLHSHTNSVHLKTKLYSCFQCNKKFADKRNVNPKRHRCIVIKNARTTCEHCSKTYCSKKSMHDHEKRVHFNRHYFCATCSAQFKFRAQLSRHARKCMI